MLRTPTPTDPAELARVRRRLKAIGAAILAGDGRAMTAAERAEFAKLKQRYRALTNRRGY
jgi:predicted aminopeptidase